MEQQSYFEDGLKKKKKSVAATDYFHPSDSSPYKSRKKLAVLATREVTNQQGSVKRKLTHVSFWWLLFRVHSV